jgi:protein TonB
VAAGPGSAEPAAGARPAGEAAGAGPAPEVSKNWEAALSAWLAAHRRYPAAARRDGVEGRVVLRITVARDGRVTGLVLAGPSGSEILDQAAMAVLRGAVVPPFPAGMPQDSVIVTVPLRYALAH